MYAAGVDPSHPYATAPFSYGFERSRPVGYCICVTGPNYGICDLYLEVALGGVSCGRPDVT